MQVNHTSPRSWAFPPHRSVSERLMSLVNVVVLLALVAVTSGSPARAQPRLDHGPLQKGISFSA